MHSETSERVSGWETKRFSGGYEGLRRLADREFSGAVSSGDSWLFLLNGRVVGAVGGELADFEDADGTVHSAPHPSLPLLFAMREQGGETRAKYYTEDTALSEADRTLSDGSFTGYVVLSENVLSGDYYVVYYGGESMSAAFVGNSRQLVTGEEAFERADDEVGIYEVKDVDVEVSEIPAPEGETEDEVEATGTGDEDAGTDAARPTDADATAGRPDSGASSDDGGRTTADVGTDVTGPADSGRRVDPDGATVDPAGSGADRSSEPAELAEPAESTEQTATTETDRTAASASDSSAVEPAGTGDDAGGSTDPDATAPSANGSRPSAGEESPPRAAGAESAAGRAESTDGENPETLEQEAAWRETTTIPALDPDDSAGTDDRSPDTSTAPADDGDGVDAGGSRRESAESNAVGAGGELRERVDALESELSAVAGERDELRAERDRLRERLDELESERDEARQRVRELRERIEELEAELDAARAGAAGVEAEADGREELSAAAALSGTNLFVRYDSKGRETLADARDGEADRASVNGNLRLETHTSFESDGVVVDGDPYGEYLADTIEYGFARWVVEDLLYEIRETDAVESLRDLYDAIPDVDRVEFDGTVSVDAEDGTGREFDVVCRDRMGDPLVVADLNDSLDAASEGQMSELVGAAQPVGERTDSLAAAFFVTASYFAPAALETADDATGGGFLSRDRRKSYVQLSRKRGFHLCLVETRNGEYHVNVPQL
ncbi:MAG: hypothetical protein ABEJ79_07210 [Halolamina sp.]